MLNPRGLDFDVDGGAHTNEVEHLVERGHGGSARQGRCQCPSGAECGDIGACRFAHVINLDRRIVVNHNQAVCRRVHVQLDAIRALVKGDLKGGEGIFMGLARRAAMGDDLRDASHGKVTGNSRGRRV